MKLKDFFISIFVTLSDLFIPKKVCVKTYRTSCVKKILLVLVLLVVLINVLPYCYASQDSDTDYSFTGLVHSDIGIILLIGIPLLVFGFIPIAMG